MSIEVVSGMGLRFVGLRQVAGYFVGREGPVVEPALDRIAARRPDESGLCGSLYTLSGYEHVHGPRDGDARHHHRAAAGIVTRLDDQRAVDLELFEAEFAQEADRGVSGAEIVERNAHAKAANHVERAAGDDRVADEVRLGDFEFEPVGREARLFEDM